MRVALPKEQVFAFFAEAANLKSITPAELHFEILTPQPIPLHEGALIDYRLRLYGVPLRWRSRIIRWRPPNEFIDEQVYGPYRLWIYTHRFHDDGGQATIIEDVVRYGLPLSMAVWGDGLSAGAAPAWTHLPLPAVGGTTLPARG